MLAFLGGNQYTGYKEAQTTIIVGIKTLSG